jgi:hypothetical protein
VTRREKHWQVGARTKEFQDHNRHVKVIEVNQSMFYHLGMVVRPITANSDEWKSEKGQEAIAEEMTNHQKRGTWDISRVVELDNLMDNCRRDNQDVML